jgi:hypothetical protein
MGAFVRNSSNRFAIRRQLAQDGDREEMKRLTSILQKRFDPFETRSFDYDEYIFAQD